MILHGKDIIIELNSTAIACAKSCEVNIGCETLECASPSVGGWKDYIAGRKSWDVNVSKYAEVVKTDMNLVGQRVLLTINHVDSLSDSIQGYAIVTGWKGVATKGNLFNGSLTFQGTGELGILTQLEQ